MISYLFLKNNREIIVNLKFRKIYGFTIYFLFLDRIEKKKKNENTLFIKIMYNNKELRKIFL